MGIVRERRLVIGTFCDSDLERVRHSDHHHPPLGESLWSVRRQNSVAGVKFPATTEMVKYPAIPLLQASPRRLCVRFLFPCGESSREASSMSQAMGIE